VLSVKKRIENKGPSTWSSLVRFSPAALRMLASKMMESPMINATTGLACCAGTLSVDGGTATVAVGDAFVMAEGIAREVDVDALDIVSS
jgi:hypothetical protein